MRVGIDLSVLDLNQAGTAIYTQGLYRGLREIEPVVRLHPFRSGIKRDMSSPKTLSRRMSTLYQDLVWTHTILPLLAWRNKTDLLHMPTGVVPLLAHCPTVVSIMDTTFFLSPQSFPAWQRLYQRLFVPISARRSRLILTISEHSKRDIMRLFKVGEEKVIVTYLAAAPEFRPIPSHECQDVQKIVGPDPFILTVGTLEPRKNLKGLIQAFARLGELLPSVRLVHVGSQGWFFDDIVTEATRCGVEDRVLFLGRVPQEQLVKLYNLAALFVYPSFYEGFGLPVLEAMACGCPVLTSNNSSLPEVAGDAGMLVDPKNIESIADAIRIILYDPALSEHMRKAGIAQASKFSWRRCAEETAQAYSRAIASQGE